MDFLLKLYPGSMMSDSYQRLFVIAEEFSDIAQNVNKSSNLRKEHSEKAIDNLDLANNTGSDLIEEMRKIAIENLNLRDKNNIILSSFKIFISNLMRQEKILKQLNGSLINPGIISKIEKINAKLNESLKTGVDCLEKIINTNNEIILMDNFIIKKKAYQKKRIEKLKEMAVEILIDALSAIEGSHSNLDRGISLQKRFKEISSFVESKKKSEIENFISEAKSGCLVAFKVNESSRSQFEFAEQVSLFTRQLHNESVSIKDLIIQKSALFNENLEPIAELAVLVAVELSEYLSISAAVKDFQLDNAIYKKEETYRLVNDLAAYILSICENIESVAALNFDMSGSIASNAVLERKTADLTGEELNYFSAVKDSVAAMTEATKYPIEGSARNIDNGMELQKLLEEILQKM
jgi:hypothetical protein